MAVVGVDIGDHSTYISVAKLGAVETISNDYSLRATPSIVAFGERQRFIGVSAENQRNLNPKSTVSFFKNTLGQKVKEVSQNEQPSYGASVSVQETGRLNFEIGNRKLESEQAMAMLFTKVKELIQASEGEEVETCVISVPIYFSQAQRQAMLDAANIAGLEVHQVISDINALALSYGKGRDLGEEKRNVVFVDCGSEGTQVALAQVSKQGATVLSTSANHVGGKVFDQLLAEHAVQLIEEKYKKSPKGNAKAMNKLRNALEKAKKQMSANTNAIPIQLESFIEDMDIEISVDRATFEQLIQSRMAEMKETFDNLMASTTVKPEDIHSVEIVGGSTRIPAIKALIQQVFGKAPSTTLNADEEVSRGCARQAASLSAKFITTKFEVTEAVHYGVEAMFVSGGQHERVIICDEGEGVLPERELEIKADFPLNIALQYTEGCGLEDKLIGLYKVDKIDATSGMFKLKFRFDNGLVSLAEAVLVSESRKRRKSENAEQSENNEAGEEATEMVACRTVLSFTKSMPEPLNVEELGRQEAVMLACDHEEILRQEEKNRLEEEMYKLRHQLMENADELESEEAFVNMKAYFDEIETWLYEEGEDAPRTSYIESLDTLRGKMKIYLVWLEKYRQIKQKEEEKKKFMEQEEQRQQQQQQQQQNQRQIPIHYEGEDAYVPKLGRGRGGHQHPGGHIFPGAGFAARRDPFQSDPFQRFGRHPQFFDDEMFGW